MVVNKDDLKLETSPNLAKNEFSFELLTDLNTFLKYSLLMRVLFMSKNTS